MRVAVFGMGYVGATTAACLAGSGHDVMGVDPSLEKLALLRAGRAPFAEEGVRTALEAALAARLGVTDSAADALAGADLALICVGTPSKPNGALDLTQVERVCAEIGAVLAAGGNRGRELVVVLRSTVLPGTTDRCAALLASGAGRAIPTAFNPEFLREATAVQDFLAPPYTIVGTESDAAAAAARALYGGLAAPLHVVPTRTAELVKYASNAYHATKVAFGNEIGRVARALGVDGHAVMDLVCKDDKLNVSARYLRPGFAYGGSCLPKDLRALTAEARYRDADVPLLESLPLSNRSQVALAFRLIVEAAGEGRPPIGLLGVAFKAGTDDLRESPMIELVERLLGRGYPVKVHDPDVQHAQLLGANRAFLDRELPHWQSLFAPPATVTACPVIVIANHGPTFPALLQHTTPDQTLLDLCGAIDPTKVTARYQNLWGHSPV